MSRLDAYSVRCGQTRVRPNTEHTHCHARTARSRFSRRHEHARGARDAWRMRALTAHSAHLVAARADVYSASCGRRRTPSVGWTWPQTRSRARRAPARARCCRPSEGLPRRHPSGGTRRARSHPAPGSTHEGREKKRRHTFPGTENLYRPAGGVTPRTAPGFSVAYHTQQFLCGHDRRLGRLLR
jgi:hypothetical protein